MSRTVSYICPQCGRETEYDPWQGPVVCPNCHYTPLEGPPSSSVCPAMAIGSYEDLLDLLLAYWNHSHQPQLDVPTPTPQFAETFFACYQQALGEDPRRPDATRPRYMRIFTPRARDIESLVRAYAMLARGETAAAALALRDLTVRASAFPDAWLWLSAACDDPAEQRTALERAVLADPAHPLAHDAWAIYSGRVSPARFSRTNAGYALVLTDCPRCGAPLQHQAGQAHVTCPYCGYLVPLEASDLINEPAPLVADLQLRRRYQGHVWEAVQRIVRCLSCGAQLTMTDRIAERCPYCDSTNVLTEDSQREFEQPDGLLPFAISNRKAAQAIARAARRLRLPGGTGLDLPPAHALRSLFLPFWAFDGFVQAQVLASSVWAIRDPEEKQIDSRTMMFENFVVPAINSLPRSQLLKLLPYDLQALVPYTPLLVADRRVALYALDVEDVVGEVSEVFRSQAKLKVRQWALEQEQRANQSDQEAPAWLNMRRSYHVSGLTYQLLLLPAWLGQVGWHGHRAVAAVNGQTGTVALDHE